MLLTLLQGCGASLHDTIARGDLEQARAMLEANPKLVSETNQLGKTPLHYAVNYKQIGGMELLQSFGADLEAQDVTGMTPLHAAAMLGRHDEARWLLDQGVDMTAQDAFGDTPVHTAACFGGGGVIRILHGRGVSVEETNAEGLTPLDLAHRYHRPAVAKELLRLKGKAES
jgi:ankyrin repeat protein